MNPAELQKRDTLADSFADHRLRNGPTIATRRARSKAEFIAKLGNVVEEADESVGWLELMRDSNIASDPGLLAEAQELCAIFTTSLATARRGR